MTADIDIDVPDRNDVIRKIKHIHAMRHGDGEVVRHNTGVYPMSLPHNPFTMEATIDYKQAEELGFIKIDILNLSVYKSVKSREHLRELSETEPNWNMLLDSTFSDMVFQLNGWSNVLQTMKPRSILELAAVIAMIRPAKKHLIGKSWEDVFADVWNPSSDGKYFFKKSHAISYAMVAVVSMNLLAESDMIHS